MRTLAWILVAVVAAAAGCGKPRNASVDKDPISRGDVTQAGATGAEITDYPLESQELEAGYSFLWRASEPVDGEDQPISVETLQKHQKVARAAAAQLTAALRAKDEKGRDKAAAALRAVTDHLALVGTLAIRVEAGKVVAMSARAWDLDGSGARDFSLEDGTLEHLDYDPRGGVHEIRLRLSPTRLARLTLSRRPAAGGQLEYGADRLEIEEKGAVIRTGLAAFVGRQ
jgi:hypothetical protein